MPLVRPLSMNLKRRRTQADALRRACAEHVRSGIWQPAGSGLLTSAHPVIISTPMCPSPQYSVGPHAARAGLNNRTRRPKNPIALAALVAASVAVLGALAAAAGTAGDAIGVIDGLCRRAPILHRVPHLCPDRMDVQVLCTSPSRRNGLPPCISFYITNPMAGFDIVGGQLEVADVYVSDSGGSPLGLNAKEATYNAKVTDNHLAVGERIPFKISGPLTGSGENISVQVCPYYTDPTQQVTLTLRPRLYSQSNEATLRDVESFEIKLRLTGLANPSTAVGPSLIETTLVAPPGELPTLEEHGCEVSRR